MPINERKRNDVTILDLKGKITIGAAEEALRDAVHRVLGAGAQKLLLNLHGRRRAGQLLRQRHQPGGQDQAGQPAAQDQRHPDHHAAHHRL
jgi:hypothetical protein